MQDNTPTPISGQLLVADFQTVFITVATTMAAKQEAERSESALVSQLSYISNGSLLNPSNLGADAQTAITRESLDAHIKKVQAEQLSALSAQQLENLMHQDKMRYVGKKVKVTVLDTVIPPIESVWFNPHTGYRNSITKKMVLAGTIEEVLLDQNALVLKPPFMSQLINRELQHYVVYIVNPDSLAPMVELTLL